MLYYISFLYGGKPFGEYAPEVRAALVLSQKITEYDLRRLPCSAELPFLIAIMPQFAVIQAILPQFA